MGSLRVSPPDREGERALASPAPRAIANAPRRAR